MKEADRLTLFAIGDCLGKPFEFHIFGDIPTNVLSHSINHSEQFQTVSDDTQLLWLTLHSIITNTDFYDCLHYWATNLVRKQDAPGEACLFAAEHKAPYEYSLGGGSVMRMPAYCILKKLGFDRDVMINNAKKTHIEDSTVKACELLLDIIDNETVPELSNEIKITSDCWKCKEILNYAIYAVNKSNNYFEVLENAIPIIGDSDTVGALAMFIASYKFSEEHTDKFLYQFNTPRVMEVNMFSRLFHSYEKRGVE